MREIEPQQPRRRLLGKAQQIVMVHPDNGDNKPRFKAEHPVTLLEGDKDVFGDGSVTVLSTPGHTPGHQSLLVKLPKTGAVILSGDAAHFKDNFENRRVPAASADQTVASMQKIADLQKKDNAQL